MDRDIKPFSEKVTTMTPVAIKYKWTSVIICVCLSAWFHVDNVHSMLRFLRIRMHKLLVQIQNRYTPLRTTYKDPLYTRSSFHCAERFERVHLFEDVLPEIEFAQVRAQLYAIDGRMGLYYNTSGRSSRVLSAFETASLAPSISSLHYAQVWLKRLSEAAGTSLYPLDDMRFPMAYSTHYYITNSFNAPHRDSCRTDSKTWTVIYGIHNNSTSELIVEGVECKLPNNAALLFEGSERVHWVPKLTLPLGIEQQSVTRTIVFLEYTELSPDRVHWRWPWRQSIAWAERVLFH